MLRSGGNAVDAAVAAVAAQGVVAPETCGLGGDLFALIHRPGWERPKALNASGEAGSKVDAGAVRMTGADEIPRTHPATVTIPGCVDGLVTLHAALGTRPWGDCLEAAIRLAATGWEVSTEQARALRQGADLFSGSPALAEFYPEGRPLSAGERVTRPKLAATLSRLAGEGRDAFYRGVPAEDIVTALGGLITLEDLARPHARWVEPISCRVGGMTAWTIPPNTQGYLGPATLAVFEMLQPPADPEDPLWTHLLVEAYRSLAWERDQIVSDPAHLPRPVESFLDRDRLANAARSVRRDRAGTWPAGPVRGGGTAYMCVVDASGLAVSVIQSNFRGIGSPFGAARSGFQLHDRGAGFSLLPGHPNELAPGKRPRHTLSPTLWTSGNRTTWVIGTRGGDLQPQFVAQVAARAVLGGTDPASAQAAPRWVLDRFGPGEASVLAMEPGLASGAVADLRGRGHLVSIVEGPQPGWGPVSLIGVEDGERRTARDPRVDTTAALVF